MENSLRILLLIVVMGLSTSVGAGDAKTLCKPLPPEAAAMEVARFTEADLTAKAVQKAVADLEAARDHTWGAGITAI